MGMRCLGLVLGLAASGAAVAQESRDDTVLKRVAHRVRDEAAGHRDPVVVLDIDDTLIDTRLRTLRIFREFGENPRIKHKYGSDADRLRSIPLEGVRYDLPASLRMAGISNPELEKELQAYWLDRFFSNRYVAGDKAYPGAAAYLIALSKAGAHLLYLTGRDSPRMREGTLASLRAEGFPLGDGAEIQMKPDKDIADDVYKKEVFDRLKVSANVVAVFENEPRNINLMKEAFPDAVAVFLRTIHSSKPDLPRREVKQIGGYGRYVNSRVRPGYHRPALPGRLRE